MIDITHIKERCFADRLGNCQVLSETIADECNAKCPFYKPWGCEEWVRIERHKRVFIVEPEEYLKGVNQ